MESFLPTSAEDLSDKRITTKSPNTWRQSQRVAARDREVNAKLAAEVVHTHTPYCGMYTQGSCRSGFPHDAEPRTRRRTSQAQYANSRWKSSLAVRRAKGDNMMGQYNIRVNTVHPGGIFTAMHHSDMMTLEDANQFYSKHAIPRVGLPREVAALSAFLASDEASYSTGAEFIADGGWSAGLVQDGLPQL